MTEGRIAAHIKTTNRSTYVHVLSLPVARGRCLRFVVGWEKAARGRNTGVWGTLEGEACPDTRASGWGANGLECSAEQGALDEGYQCHAKAEQYQTGDELHGQDIDPGAKGR